MNKLCMSKMIPPGSSVSVRVENDSSWSLNIVCCCDDDYIDIPLTSDLLKSFILYNETINIKFKNEYFEYIISGTIARIELCGSPYIRVKIQNITANKNHREFPRRDVILPANLAIDSKNNYFCTVTNISLGGIAFLLDKEIPNATQCEANIFLNENSTVYVKGVILRSINIDPFYKFSMRFTYMNEEDSNFLHSYLHSIDNSRNLLISKYL